MKYAEEDALSRRDQLRRLAVEVKERTFVAKSKDGLVSVSVLGTGQIVGLDLDPRIYRSQDSQKLAAVILDTLRRASNAAVRVHLRSLEEITGGNIGSFQGLISDAENVVNRLFDEAEDVSRYRQ